MDYLEKLKLEKKDRRRRDYDRTADNIYKCRGCGVRKRGDEYYFNAKYTNGRDLSECKRCHIDLVNGTRSRRYKMRRLYNRARAEFFMCRTCGENKRGWQFVFHYRFAKGVYVTACKECKRAKDKEYYASRKKKAEAG